MYSEIALISEHQYLSEVNREVVGNAMKHSFKLEKIIFHNILHLLNYNGPIDKMKVALIYTCPSPK